MTFFTELGTALAADIVSTAIKRKTSRVKAAFSEFGERARDGSLGIFVLGPQGTGKTSLMEILSQARKLSDPPPEYESSARSAKAKLRNHVFFRVYAGPGQAALRDAFWPGLFNEMPKYDRVIVIFCTSYGHHAFYEESFEKMVQVGINTSEPLAVAEYLERKRTEESRLFTELCTKLSAVNGRLGLMLLVTKQDLWWDKRAEVQKHYNRGAFAKGRKRLEQAKRSLGCIFEQQSVSLSVQNLLTSDRKLVVPTASGYDQVLQLINFKAFERALLSMAASLKG